MDIKSVSPVQNQTNFKAIKSIRYDGLYKKFPEEGKKLLETFKQNEKAIEFCKKYDVNIVFHACKKYMNAVQSSINIYFKDPSKNFLNKIVDAFAGHEDCIRIHGFGNEYQEEKSLLKSSRELASMIASQTMVTNKFYDPRKSGMLNSHIEVAEKNIARALEKNTYNSQQQFENTNANLNKNKEELSNLINELKETTKK